MEIKKICLLLFLLAPGLTAISQIHIGANTSYNATFVLDKGLSNDPRYSSTYTYHWAPIGINFGIDFGKKFGLSLESILSKQGQIYNLVNTAKQVAGERKIDLQYINLPLLLNFMGGGSGKFRSNFNFGPQLSLINKAVETIQANAGTFTMPNPNNLSAADLQAAVQQDFPTAVFDPNNPGNYSLPGAGTFPIPTSVTLADIQSVYPTAIDAGNGQYTIPANGATMAKDLLSKQAGDFKNAEFQLAASFGFSVDLSEHLLLSTQVRANYGLTDMRKGDVINSLKNGNISDVFGARSNLIVGVQIGLHYYFSVLRSFK